MPKEPKLSGLALAMAACGLLSGTPVEAAVIAGSPGTSYSGLAPSPGVDEYDFSGLTPGSSYDFFVMDNGGGDGGLLVDLYHDAVTPGDLIDSADLVSQQSHDFTGLVPPSGLLILTLQTGPTCSGATCEGYGFHLTARTGNAPEPATLALVGAGLVGAFVTRRRKRR